MVRFDDRVTENAHAHNPGRTTNEWVESIADLRVCVFSLDLWHSQTVDIIYNIHEYHCTVVHTSQSQSPTLWFK
jgi:hypothetical protein